MTEQEIKNLQDELKAWKTRHRPPGHFYSPFADPEELEAHPEVFDPDQASLPAIDLNADQQRALLNEFLLYYAEQDLPDDPSPEYRFYHKNIYFSYSDALFLYFIMRHYKPQRVIEVGSGHSSALMLDINERYLGRSCELTFIEPYPDRLNELLNEEDKQQHTIIPAKVQYHDPAIFSSLKAGDLLFIDSSHVAKAGSDVNYLIFQVLPRLAPGVIVHFHDVFYPFEYPREWVLGEDRAWHESYLLHAFLQYNEAFRILIFNSYLEWTMKDWFQQHMPTCLKSGDKCARQFGYELITSGRSLYIQKR